MSAVELIQQVTELPPQERTRFEELFRLMGSGNGNSEAPRMSGWPDFRERLTRIYGEAVVPDSQSVIDDGRGGY